MLPNVIYIYNLIFDFSLALRETSRIEVGFPLFLLSEAALCWSTATTRSKLRVSNLELLSLNTPNADLSGASNMTTHQQTQN